MTRTYNERVFGSIFWASKSILYHGWRLQSYFSWLFVAASRSVEDCRQSIDSLELALTLRHFAEFEIPSAIDTCGRKEELANQLAICIQGIAQGVVAMCDFKDADEWDKAVVRLI